MSASFALLSAIAAIGGDGICGNVPLILNLPRPKGGTGGGDDEPRPIGPLVIILERLVAAAAGLALWSVFRGESGADTRLLAAVGVGLAAGLCVGAIAKIAAPRA
ncbi:MAG: hypothetical protein JO013_05825 [Alphaproteobacteria bacterium]|nr:hypothetical protein [Alphaproteobacteria bacterium]